MHAPPEPSFAERDALELAERIETHAVLLEKLAFYEGLAEDPELVSLLSCCRALFVEHVKDMEGLLKAARDQSDWSAYTHYSPHDYGSPRPYTRFGPALEPGWGTGPACGAGSRLGSGSRQDQQGVRPGHSVRSGFNAGSALSTPFDVAVGCDLGVPGRVEAGEPRMRPPQAPRGLSERVIALDVLHALKYQLLADAASLAAAVHPRVRELFRRMAADHEVMAAEAAALARRRGWRREPGAQYYVAAQLAHGATRWRAISSVSEKTERITEPLELME